jgi:Fic family protein
MLTKKQQKILKLQKDFLNLKREKDSLLKVINEVEIPEAVYNSNAIENSTLTISETEDILLNMEISRYVSLREIFEAKNLAKVSDYIFKNHKRINLDNENILLLHKMLILNINNEIAGRFRNENEFVRVGRYIAPNPKDILKLLEILIQNFEEYNSYVIRKIAELHLGFEKIHPFVDGNGRVGRLLINLLLLKNNFPPIIIRDNEKQKYYEFFKMYDKEDPESKKKAVREFSNFLQLQVSESLNKRIAYLKGVKIITISNYAKENNIKINILLNKAKRQTIPAFREKGV